MVTHPEDDPMVLDAQTNRGNTPFMDKEPQTSVMDIEPLLNAIHDTSSDLQLVIALYHILT